MALELIGERGVSGFSMAEASRRLGVAVSAPYAHFPDRDALVAAVALRAARTFNARVAAEVESATTPSEQLAGAARAYVRFAGQERSLFDVLYRSGVDKHQYPDLKEAHRELNELLMACVAAIAGRDEELVSDLSDAVEATAEGYALLLFNGDYGTDVEGAARRAGAAVLALIRGRRLLQWREADR